MSDSSVPTIAVDWRIEIGLSLLAIAAGALAAYYTGKTGEPHPLFGVCAGLTMVVLFLTSSR